MALQTNLRMNLRMISRNPDMERMCGLSLILYRNPDMERTCGLSLILYRNPVVLWELI